ncbi:MAG: alpha/beta fold hydrolase [Planctomycetota bacterium]
MGFDLHPGPSLARTLAAQGFDTFALELRGRGLSERPRLGGARRYGWDFDAYLRRDLPAAVDRVLREVGASRAHWVGHSMGGVLLYAALATGAEWVRSGVALGSALDYSGSPSDFQALLAIQGLTRVLPALPFGPMAWVTSPLAGRVPNRIEEFNIWPRNVEPAVARQVNASCFHPVSTPVLLQLSSALEPGGLRSADGALRYAEGLGVARAPVLALVATKDRQCHPDAARRTLEGLGSLRKEVHVLGPDAGCAEHYGHFDLLCGRHAHLEVFPRVLAWLREHD